MKCITMCSTLELAAEVTGVLTVSAREAALHHMSGLGVRCVWLFFLGFVFFPHIALNNPERKIDVAKKGVWGGGVIYYN